MFYMFNIEHRFLTPGFTLLNGISLYIALSHLLRLLFVHLFLHAQIYSLFKNRLANKIFV